MAFFDKLSDFTGGFAEGFGAGGLQQGLALGAQAGASRRAEEALQMRRESMDRTRFQALFESDPAAAIAQAREEGNEAMVGELTRMQMGQTGQQVTELMGSALDQQSAVLAQSLGTAGRENALADDMTEASRRNSAVNRYVQQRFGNEKDPRGWETFLADEDFHMQYPHIKGLTDNYRSMGVDIYKDMSTARDRELHYSDLYAQAAYLASQPSQGEYEKARDDAAGLFENPHRASAFIARLDNMRRDSVRTTVLEIAGRSKTKADVDVAAAYETDDPIAQAAIKAAERAAGLNQLKEVGYGIDLLAKAVDADVAGDVGEMESYLELYNEWAKATGNDTIDAATIVERSRNQSRHTLLNTTASKLTNLQSLANAPLPAHDQLLIDEYDRAYTRYLDKPLINIDPTLPKMSATAKAIAGAQSKINGLLRTYGLNVVNFAEENARFADERFVQLLDKMVSSDLEIRGLSGASVGMPPTSAPGHTGTTDFHQGDVQPDDASGSGGRAGGGNVFQYPRESYGSGEEQSTSLGPMAVIVEDILSTPGITEAEARQEFLKEYEEAAKSETKEDMAKWWRMVQGEARKMGLNVGSAPGNLGESAGDLLGPILPLPDRAENFFGPPKDPAAARESVPKGIFSPEGRPSPVGAAPPADATAAQPQVPPAPAQQGAPPPAPITGMGGRDLNAPPQLPAGQDIPEGDYYPGRADDVWGWKDGLTGAQIREVVAATKEIKAPSKRFTDEDFHETRELLFPRDPGPYPPQFMGSEFLERGWRSLTDPPVRQPTNAPISRSYGR